MRKSILFEKSKIIVPIGIKMCIEIQKDKKEYDITRQLIRSLGSVLANISEGSVAEGRKDFIHKYSIARKELSESFSWIYILNSLNYINKEKHEEIDLGLTEIYKMINSSISTARKNLNND